MSYADVTDEKNCASAVNVTLNFAFLYIFFMTSNICFEIPEASILDHKADLFLVANVFYNRRNNSIYYAYLGTNS